jgi:peptide/nickel transport system substrate-binding protein
MTALCPQAICQRWQLWVLVALLTSLTALGQRASAINPSETLDVVLASNETGLAAYDPFSALITNEPWGLIYETLVTEGLDGRYYPRLATGWSESADGLTWRFELRRSVRFHDGTPFTAQSVAWMIERLRDSPSGLLVEMVREVEVVDDHAIVLHLLRPSPNLLFNLSMGFAAIPSPTAVQRLGRLYGVAEAVGTGPYELESFQPGKLTVLRRNAGYRWGGPLTQNRGPARIERIRFREIADESAQFLALKTGDVDLLLEVPPIFRRLISRLPDVRLDSIIGQDNWHLVMNTQARPLDDIRVRTAISLAIDAELIVQALFPGSGQPADTYLTPALPENRVAPRLRRSYDPERAADLLQSAGWAVGKGRWRYKEGELLELNLWTRNTSEFRRVAEAIQAQLAHLGIKVALTQFDQSSIRTQYHLGRHQLALSSYGSNNADVLEWFFNSARLGYPNVAMWNDARSDALMRAAMTAPTAPARVRGFTRYHEYLLSKFLWVPIYWPNDNFAYDAARLHLPEIRTFTILDPAILDARLLH